MTHAGSLSHWLSSLTLLEIQPAIHGVKLSDGLQLEIGFQLEVLDIPFASDDNHQKKTR
jgi:hypothetical protein